MLSSERIRTISNLDPIFSKFFLGLQAVFTHTHTRALCAQARFLNKVHSESTVLNFVTPKLNAKLSPNYNSCMFRWHPHIRRNFEFQVMSLSKLLFWAATRPQHWTPNRCQNYDISMCRCHVDIHWDSDFVRMRLTKSQLWGSITVTPKLNAKSLPKW